MIWRAIILLVAFLALSNSELVENRIKKAVSIFNVVKFKNDPCGATDMRNGTCYTESECQELSGTASGSCAEGYGVCCVFTVRCGQKTSENNTYFQSSGTETGACNAKVCAKSGVCQLRLDFPKFDIAQPSNSVALAGEFLINGAVVKEGGKAVSTMGQCLTDTFTVTSPGSVTPPTICGTNDGQHMYIDASDSCNILSFQLAGTGKRSWEIKVTQLNCNFNNLAPSGCTQYHYGSVEGTIQSFNYVGGLHLAKQNQKICIRRELNMCRICYATAMGAMKFDISSVAADSMGILGKSDNCCGYGADGMVTNVGFDCLVIPGASKQADSADLKGSEFCGRQLASLMSESARATICSKVLPFQVRFLSDNWEYTDGMALGVNAFEAGKVGEGFEITYTQSKCTA